ncbi:MAG TPA: FMN-binding protein [Vicinamibacterales bacterium]|nr:FMN-binding protein [Vicinamibacterales bacterium]HOG28783.1 FMN-binding protein [Vicinamibacterales bacterium]HOQ59296.1 FMN-binding protein [Vicinamibacterales bacterium]HPK71727.1 FMN-binding protein [Vicinamibacterales bacterium]HPW19386.1 FMN-binding protein [Vicinamibacterales bacterium]
MKTMLHMVATLVIVGLVAGASLSLVSGWAQPLIEANETKVKMAGVMEVVPGGVSSKTLAEIASATPAPPGGDVEAYQVLDAQGQVLGWAVIGEGTGFSDKIRLMVGVAPDFGRTLGIRILKDAETPGLGTKIREGDFPDRFFGRGGQAPSLGDGPLTVVKAPPGAANEVQAITGATISSKAVVKIVNEGVARLRARVGAGAAGGGTGAPAAPGRGEAGR